MTPFIIHILLGLLLLAIPVAALYFFDRSLLRRFLLAVARMSAQLLALCFLVWLLFRYECVGLLLLWLAAMSVVGGAVVLRHIGVSPFSRRLPVVAVGLLLAVLLVGAWLLCLSLPGASFGAARWFVPVMLLLLGHTMTMLVRGLSTFDSALLTDSQQLEFLLGNGASQLQAHLPMMRRALQAIVSPTVANLSVLGLATMPLLLCGLFLGGLTPPQAFVAMLSLVVGCVASSVLALLVVLWLTVRGI